jgi:hypothetical protein
MITQSAAICMPDSGAIWFCFILICVNPVYLRLNFFPSSSRMERFLPNAAALKLPMMFCRWQITMG